MKKIILIICFVIFITLAGCKPAASVDNQQIQVVVVETFLADITRNVAGDRVEVTALMPEGVDPHSFEPMPKDIAILSHCDLLIINGAGYEEWLQGILQNLPQKCQIVEASAGLEARKSAGDAVDLENQQHLDPHFWLNPLNVIRYVENIRDSLIAFDPDGKEAYDLNADTYIVQLKDLDKWITDQVSTIPVERRLLVTNHESLGYFADEYGFRIIGAIVPSVTSSASPSAQQMAELIQLIREQEAPAIFLEIGANSQLAEQIAGETGVVVVADIYTESITDPEGEAPTYLDMMRVNVEKLVNALK